jgi:hypothetical protein
MSRNHSIFLLMLVSLLFFLFVIWLWPTNSADKKTARANPSAQSTQSTAAQVPLVSQESSSVGTKKESLLTQQEKRLKVAAQIEATLNTPITFYGKVVDQNGKLIPNVRVGYALLDKFNESGSNAHKFADATGYFEISRVKGAVIGVNVSKESYYQIHNVSNQSFAYGIGADGGTKPPPSKDNPAVFVLQKMGETESLIKFEKYFKLSRKGEPVEVSLATGEVLETGKSDIRIEAWTNDQATNEQGRYDWKCKVSVPGGGLIKRAGQFDFEAPKQGYKLSDDVIMSQNADNWQSDIQRSYFIQLSNGCYARIEFRMIAGGNHYCKIESYLNPTPGSRNLEYDPAKRINP